MTYALKAIHNTIMPASQFAAIASQEARSIICLRGARTRDLYVMASGAVYIAARCKEIPTGAVFAGRFAAGAKYIHVRDDLIAAHAEAAANAKRQAASQRQRDAHA